MDNKILEIFLKNSKEIAGIDYIDLSNIIQHFDEFTKIVIKKDNKKCNYIDDFVADIIITNESTFYRVYRITHILKNEYYKEKYKNDDFKTEIKVIT